MNRKDPKKKRALLLLNHTTLLRSQIPILQKLGYELYIPKKFTYDEGNLSASIDYSCDSGLSIPRVCISHLNNLNLYENIDSKAIQIFNEYFDIAFFGIFPDQIRYLLTQFRGKMILEAFGLTNDLTYTDILLQYLGHWAIPYIRKLGNRFVFGKAYEDLDQIESATLKRNAIYLPLGLSNAKQKEQWRGNINKIMFVCPRINTSGYFNKIYRDFKRDFKNFDYTIAGAQPIAVLNDKQVTGYLSRDEYENLMKTYKVMYYHSIEKYHVHYHPFEAVQHGMPLIFMAGGQLDKLGGLNLPGRASSVHEARQKLSKILNGDLKFITQVKESQKILLKCFDQDYCFKIWKKSISKIEKNNSYPTNVKKIGVLLPAEYTGGVLDFTSRLIKILKNNFIKNNIKAEVVLFYPKHHNFKNNAILKSLIAEKVSLREFEWKIISNAKLIEILKLLQISPTTFSENEYALIDDKINYASDMDHLIFTSDRTPSNFFSFVPYSVVIHDYVQYTTPGLLSEDVKKYILDLQRNAYINFVTSENTYKLCLQYAGLNKSRICKIPFPLDYLELENKTTSNITKDYFIWSTNTSQHKNHLNTISELRLYYAQGGKLDCYITGSNTEFLDPDVNISGDDNNDYVNEVRSHMTRFGSKLKKHIKIWGNLPKRDYIALIKGAKFILHPGEKDAGNATSFDAALFGVPTLSNDYPGMREFDSTHKLKVTFCNIHEYGNLCNKLLQLERHIDKYIAKLPKRSELKKFTITSKTSEELFQKISYNIGIFKS